MSGSKLFGIRPPANCTPSACVHGTGRVLASVDRTDDESVSTLSRQTTRLTPYGVDLGDILTVDHRWPASRRGTRAEALPRTRSTGSSSGFRQSVARRPEVPPTRCVRTVDIYICSWSNIHGNETIRQGTTQCVYVTGSKLISIYKRRIAAITSGQRILTKGRIAVLSLLTAANRLVRP